MARPRAADDFAAIRARLLQLRERAPVLRREPDEARAKPYTNRQGTARRKPKARRNSGSFVGSRDKPTQAGAPKRAPASVSRSGRKESVLAREHDRQSALRHARV